MHQNAQKTLNKTENILGTERTKLVFNQDGFVVDRLKSTLYDYVDKSLTNTWHVVKNNYDVTILLDRSMLEIYIDGIISFTTRIYPKYGDSDFLKLFDTNGNMNVNKLTIKRMKSAYSDEVTPAWYGNTGNLADALY